MLDARSEWNGNVEVGVITHNGQEYRSGGSYVDDKHAVGYLTTRVGGLVITSWDGTRELGPAWITSTWRIPRSFVSSTQSAVRARINGRVYAGRSAGVGMLWRGRAVKG